MESDAESSDIIELSVPGISSGLRLDRYLTDAVGEAGREVSRAVMQTWIKDGAVTVNGVAVKPRHTVLEGDRVIVEVPKSVASELLPEAIDLDVLYEDDDIIVVNKSHGLVVHPASGNMTGTLVNALLHHCQGNLCELAGDDRPGIVHRLDKDTSGCLVAAKSEQAYHSLVAQFSGRKTGKKYIAVTNGMPTSEAGTIETNIGRHPGNRQKMAVVEPPGGKDAITDFETLNFDEAGKWATLLCVIRTGRTHQIRVHLKECLHSPILGDPIYGHPKRQKIQVGRLMLHARELSITHPVTKEKMTFESPLPDAFSPFVEG